MAPTLAILSDIHGNLEALEAVLADMRVFKPDHVVVLGDTIGYGPQPRECLELVHEVADLVLLGNHERDALVGSPRMRDSAAQVIEWTREQLADSPTWRAIESGWRGGGARYLGERCQEVRWDVHFLHGGPDEPFDRYSWPGNRNAFLVANARIDEHLTRLLDGLHALHGFCGHTHVPAVLTDYENHPMFMGTGPWNRAMTFLGPRSIFFVPGRELRLTGLAGRRALLNPGSVGQPRDGIPAASYGLYDGNTWLNRRVGYPLEETQRKILNMDLPAETRTNLVERLDEGR